MPSFGRYSGDDPLGIAVQERGRQAREAFNREGQENAAAHGQLVNFSLPSNPMSPMWEGLFQAMDEQGVNKVGDNSVGVKRGMWGDNPYQSTFNPDFQTTAERVGSHIATPHPNFSSSLPPQTANPAFQTPIPSQAVNGLQGAFESQTPGGSGWQVKRTEGPMRGPRIETQRGTTGMNISQRAVRPNPNIRGYGA